MRRLAKDAKTGKGCEDRRGLYHNANPFVHTIFPFDPLVHMCGRVHCLNSLFAFLQEGGVANGSDFHIAEDDLLFRCGAERLLLAEALAALGKFMGLLDGIMSFVNCERVAISVERECELRRNDTARILDSKNDLFLLISAATKKKDKMTVQKLKQVSPIGAESNAICTHINPHTTRIRRFLRTSTTAPQSRM